MNIEYKTDFFKKLERLGIPRTSRYLCERAAVVAVNFSKERFVMKNWVDGGREAWKARKYKSKGSLLNKSGRLKRSIRKLSVGDNFVIIGTDVPYAKIHNEGGETTKISNVRTHNRTRNNKTHRVRAHRRKMNLRMPKRQFLGNSKTLGRRIERQMARDITEMINRRI